MSEYSWKFGEWKGVMWVDPRLGVPVNVALSGTHSRLVVLNVRELDDFLAAAHKAKDILMKLQEQKK